MPLDQVGLRYAQTLYNQKFAELQRNHVKRMTDIRSDHVRRGVERSGFFFGAVAREGSQFVEEQANAFVDAQLQAYQKSEVPIDDQAVADISRAAARLCDAQGSNVANHVSEQITQARLPSTVSEAIAKQVETAMAAAKVVIHRRLSLVRDEQILAARQAPSVTPQPSPHREIQSPPSRPRLSMSRGTKFGYGFLLAGVGLPFLIDQLFGPTTALIAAGVCLVAGICFLVAGHLHERRGRAPKIISALIATVVIAAGIAWRLHRTRLSLYNTKQVTRQRQIGNATTNGANSPAVTGDKNTIQFGQSSVPEKKPKSQKKE